MQIFVFLFGLAVGSFLNVVIYRLDFSDQPLLKRLNGRSCCRLCLHQLSWLDLIPVLSFLLLGGKCHYCRQKISFQYPLVETATALLFLLILNFEFRISNKFEIYNLIHLFFLFYLWSSLIVIFVYDLKHFLIPTNILFLAIAVTLLYQFIFDFNFLFFNSFWIALGSFFAFLCAYLFPPREKYMGFGDVQLAFLLGLALGFPNILVALFLSFFLPYYKERLSYKTE